MLNVRSWKDAHNTNNLEHQVHREERGDATSSGYASCAGCEGVLCCPRATSGHKTEKKVTNKNRGHTVRGTPWCVVCGAVVW